MIRMKIVIGITGASGVIYADILLRALHTFNAQLSEVAVVFSESAKLVWKHEQKNKPELYTFRSFENSDLTAPTASGSAGYDAMVICPCSMGTLARVSHGISDTLITRSADVMLKERKKLILVVRETPYNLIHIKNMETLTQAGGIICAASPSFYSQPKTIEEACETVVFRILSLLGIHHTGYVWGSNT
ncbi:MAG: UbiX family flavin prenyltransferase [Bacteroidales bacterium]|nr:UbiX family flavin prenyltransferase [Bacteroidales bacterium]